MKIENPLDVPAVQNGTEPQFLDDPAMNFIRGKVAKKDGGLVFRSEGLEFFLPVSMGKAIWRQGVNEKEEVLLGVRLEHISVATRVGIDDIHLQGEVVALEPLDMETLAVVQVGKDRVRCKVMPTLALHCGDNINVVFNRCHSHLFHVSSGKIIQYGLPLSPSRR